MSTARADSQRLWDRANPEYTQAKGHNQRVKERYPEIWAKSVLTNDSLSDWVKEHKGSPCPYCGTSTVEIDHKHPLSKGGEHSIANLQMLCLDCNRSKHDMTDEEFKAQRAVAPKVSPRFLSLADYGVEYSILKDKMKRFRTRSLFKEVWNTTPNKTHPPIFTLKRDDDYEDERWGLQISIKRLYLDIADPTEYRFALAVFNDPRHWGHLCKQQWFLKFAQVWRAELKAKIRATATERLLQVSASGGNGALAAIKAVCMEDFLFTSYLDSEATQIKKGRGRPRKVEEVFQEEAEVISDDAARVGL